jgi:hypothetical protein
MANKNIERLAKMVGGADGTIGTTAMDAAVQKVKEDQAKKAQNLAEEILTSCTSLAADAQKLQDDCNAAVAEIDTKIGEHLDNLTAITTTDTTVPTAS